MTLVVGDVERKTLCEDEDDDGDDFVVAVLVAVLFFDEDKDVVVGERVCEVGFDGDLLIREVGLEFCGDVGI